MPANTFDYMLIELISDSDGFGYFEGNSDEGFIDSDPKQGLMGALSVMAKKGWRLLPETLDLDKGVAVMERIYDYGGQQIPVVPY